MAIHAAALGLMQAGDCSPRQGTPGYTDCKFVAKDGKSMEVSFYFSQLQRVGYTFGANRYNEVLGEIEKVHGTPRTLHDPKDPSFEMSEEWGGFKERFSISLGKTADGASGFAIAVFNPPAHEAPERQDTVNRPNDAPPSLPHAEEPTLRTDEVQFVSMIESFRVRYNNSALNEFQKSTVRRQRAAALAGILPGRSVDGWIGTVSAMSTTTDGDGILSINPLAHESITIKSGINLFGSNTLIRPGSQLYEEVSRLSVGETVAFSGIFEPGDLDYLKEESLTEAGSMRAPEFMFRFATVRPASEAH